jgi:hypothetical protein
MREAELLLEDAADRVLVAVDAEALLDDPLEVDAAPAHHPGQTHEISRLKVTLNREISISRIKRLQG